MRGIALGWLVVVSVLAGCSSSGARSGDSCSINADCDEGERCISRRCRASGDSGSGGSSGNDAGPVVVLDAALLPSLPDAAVPSSTASDAGSPFAAPDASFARPDAFVAPVDAAFARPDAFVPPDAALPCDRALLAADTSPRGAVNYAYCMVLGRRPDGPGAEYYLAQLEGGLSRGDLAHSIFMSVERNVAALDDVAFVGALYRSLLWREPDTDGAAYSISQVRSGRSRDQMATDFVFSAEFCAVHLPLRHAGCR